MRKKKICWVTFAAASSLRNAGGFPYERSARDALSSADFEVVEVDVGVNGKKPRWLRILIIMRKLLRISRKTDFDIVVKGFYACIFSQRSPAKNIAVIHHVDYSASAPIVRVLFAFIEKVIFRNLRAYDRVVTVSSFWEEYARNRGLQNVCRIPNAFEVDDFEILPQEITDFKKRYSIGGKPVIYIGNCQVGKGTAETYEKLRDLDVLLVTSGTRQIQISARNFDLSYREYLLLLRVSSIVITMSTFKEGWCRTAHEAMLLKRPVIGSGKGGMRELLEGGKQIICEDFDNLRERVVYLLEHPEEAVEMGRKGYQFAAKFRIEEFQRSWRELVASEF